MSDIKDRLLAACNGHPTAAIPWPHRLLHDAIDQIEAQQARIAELEALYDKAFSGSGGLLHRKELVRMLDERDAQLAELREAAREVVAWDWAELKYSPYHVDWFEALVDVGLLEKLLQESDK